MQQNDAITYNSGKFGVSAQLTATDQFKAVLPLIAKNKSRLRDLIAYLYFMRSPLSIFNSMPDDIKLRNMCASGHISEQGWLKLMAEKDEVIALLAFYEAVAMRSVK